MDGRKSVTISDNGHKDYFYYHSDQEFNNDWIRESAERSRSETVVIKKPRTQLENVKAIIALWRKYKVNIVFGNLGRQPDLLNYFLDLCIGHEEDINIFCRWDLHSHYQSNLFDKKCDFLFFIEPIFGSTILKPPAVKHLVVLTSHLYLDVSNPNKELYLMHLFGEKGKLENPNLQEGNVYKPPIYHGQIKNDMPGKGPIFLDLNESRSANETYLRLLTGKEMLRRRPFKILMKDRDRNYLRKVLDITKFKLKQFKNYDKIKHFYFDI